MNQSEEGSLVPSDIEHLDNITSDSIKKGRKKACSKCIWRESKPRLGHTLCSRHRACSQKEFWTPMQCIPCKKQLDSMNEMNEQEVTFTKGHFEKMLSETKSQFDALGKFWEYKLPAQVFFGELGGFNQLPEKTTYNSGLTSAMESKEAQGDHTRTFPDDDQYDHDRERVYEELLSQSEGPYGSSSPEECTHSQCAAPTRRGEDCDDPIHKGKGFF